MNSAAKLRTRGIAALGATALIATAFGPAALAWDEAPGNSNAAKGGSFGIVDADRNTSGTQGVQLIAAGANDQLLAQMQFVIPATWKAGDTLTFALTQPGDAATDVTKRISFNGTPTVGVDATAFDDKTHIAAKSGEAAPEAGSVQDGKETKYVTPQNAVAPKAPEFTTTLASSTNNAAYQDQIVLKFTNTNDNSATSAKFIGVIDNAKVNVGSGVEAAPLKVTATAKNADGSAVAELFVDESGDVANETYPAVVTNAKLTVDGGLVADGSTQTLGAISLGSANNTQLTGAVTLALASTGGTGAAFATTPGSVTATQYNASGAVVGTPVKVNPTAAGLTMNIVGTGVAKVTFTGAAVKVDAQNKTVTINATAQGGLTPPAALPTAAPVNQTDLTVESTTSVTIRPTQPVSRANGFDRYSTATRLAADSVNTAGEQKLDSVVLASGANYADALSAGYLAQVKGARVILTQPNMLPGATSDFIRSHGVKNVYIVGGTGAVSTGVENALKGMQAHDVTWDAGNTTKTVKQLENQKLNVVRIGGSNRFVTNRNVNRYAYETGTGKVGTMVPAYGQSTKNTAILVNGMTPWDALAAGPMVSKGLPVILTSGSTLADQAKGQLGDFSIGYAIVVGGTGVVPEAAVKELGDRSVASYRAGGSNRFETANAVNTLLLKPTAVDATTSGPEGFGFTNTNDPYLVNGGLVSGKADASKWADALAVGPVAAKGGNLVLLTDSATLPAQLKTFLSANKTLGAVTAVGGTSVVSNAVVQAANTILGK